MKSLAEQEGMSPEGFSYFGHPLDLKPTLFSQMILGKRIAWHIIYNDYIKTRSQD